MLNDVLKLSWHLCASDVHPTSSTSPSSMFFNTHLNPVKCKNKKAQRIFVDVRLVVETMNKLETLKDVVDAITKDEFGYFIKQKNAFGH